MASFDENGKYIKTNWKAGDKITATKLNKIEESIEAVNDNDISRHVEADARLDALEAKDVAHDKEFTNVKNLIADNKAAAELGDYEINSRMTFLENELNEGIEEVHNVAETVDGKIATAEANMAAQVSRGKADMEAMVAEVEADLEGLHAKDEELSEQLEHITTNLKSNISLESYEHLVSNIGTSDECWANAFEQACIDLKDGGILYCIGRQYQFKTSIVIPSHIKLVGIKSSTIFKYNGTGTFVTLQNMTLIENITFKGDDTKEQIGVHITSWNGVLKQCDIMDFYKGVLCTGVLITIDNCYIASNDTGIEVEQVTKSDGSKVFSTMVKIVNSLIHYNNVGVFADGVGDLDRDIIMFTIENCAVEHNGYGLKLPAVMLGSIKKCWFEANTNNSEVKPWGWVLEQNRFENGDKINWICGEWDNWSGNAITQIESDTIKSRRVTLQRFEDSNKTIVDYDLFINNSGDLECGGEYIKKIPSNGTSHKYLKTYYVLINKDNVRSTNLPSDSYSLEKTSTGRYCLSLSGGYAFYLPIINANATNNWGGGAVTCAVQTHNSIDEADYKDWFTVNKIAFVCKNVETNEDVDATVMVTIHCQEIATTYGI